MRGRLSGLAVGAVVGFVVGLAAAIVVPAAFGWRTLTVMSGSMSPAIRTGDAVVTRPVAPGSLRAGDVVTFRDPEGTKRLITHRVRAVRTTGASLEVTTKGDANSGSERWQVARHGRVGRVVYRVPMAGYVLAPTASPLGRLALVAVPTFLLGLFSLATIWRTKPAPIPLPVLGRESVDRRPVLPQGTTVPLALPPGAVRLALSPGPVRLALSPGPVRLALPPGTLRLALPTGSTPASASAAPHALVLAHAAP